MHRVTIRYTLDNEAHVVEKVQIAPDGATAAVRASAAFKAMLPTAHIDDIVVD